MVHAYRRCRSGDLHHRLTRSQLSKSRRRPAEGARSRPPSTGGELKPRPRLVKGEFHQRQLVDASDPFYKPTPASSPEFHQRQLVDASDPFYNIVTFVAESHQRQWSDPLD